MQAQSLTSCGKAKVATTSARRSGLCKPNHLQSVGRQRWQQHQQGGLDFPSPITYFLWEGKCGNNISKEVWTLQAQSLTNFGKANVATTSARRSGLCKPNHLHSVASQRGNSGNNISNQVWTLQAQSLTSCRVAKVATTSARRSGLSKPNHLHPVGRQRWQQHQQADLDFAIPITYMLWEGKSSNNISKEVWTLQAQSLTYCGKAKAATTSARRSGLCKPNHLQAVGRQMWQQHQQ